MIGLYNHSNWRHLEKETTKTKSFIAHKTRESFWKYSFEFEGKKTKFCKKFLMNLYQISEKRVKTVEKKLLRDHL